MSALLKDWQKSQVEKAPKKGDIFHPGDLVKVFVKVFEGDKERIQPFEGVVLRRKGAGFEETFTVRKMSYGIGVERTFPVYAPVVQKIKVIKKGKVRRAKLYYLRGRIGKRAKIAEGTGSILSDENVPAVQPDKPQENENQQQNNAVS